MGGSVLSDASVTTSDDCEERVLRFWAPRRSRQDAETTTPFTISGPLMVVLEVLETSPRFFRRRLVPSAWCSPVAEGNLKLHAMPADNGKIMSCQFLFVFLNDPSCNYFT